MIAQWMLYSIAVALILGAAALPAERVARLYGLPCRWVWALAAAGSLVLPALALHHTDAARAGHEGTLGLLRSTASAAGGATPVRSGGAVLLAMLHAAAGDVVALLDTVRAAATRLDTALSPLNPVLLSVWALMSVSVVVYIGLSGWRLRQVLKRSRPERVDGHDVLISTSTGPAVIGVWRQRIVLPAWVLQQTDGARRLIVEHEHEHVAAWDPRLLASSFAALALMPWNPVLWWQTRRLRLALEVDCDTRVLRDAPDRHGYGSLLLDVVERGGRNAFAPTFAEPLTLLERRIRALSDPPPRARGPRTVLAFAGPALLVAAACVTPRPGSTTLASVAGRETAERTVPTRFSFVVTSNSTGIAAVCSRGCLWKSLTARWPDGKYTITDRGVAPVGRPEDRVSDGGFSITLASDDGQVSATCTRGCAWRTVSGTTPARRYRITQTGIEPLGRRIPRGAPSDPA